MKRFMLGLIVCATALSVMMAGDISFIETFALSKDRSVSLKQLIPGTEDYYYFHCLHFLQTEQYGKIREMNKPWVDRHGESQRYLEIQTRLALQEYDRNPQQSLGFLKHRLGLSFNHQKENLGAIPNFPTVLDQALFARDRLRTHSFNNWGNLDNFEDAALDGLAATNLDWRMRRQLLQRLSRPDLPNLVALVVEDLKSPETGGFGSINIHRLMTLAQLEELLRARTDLINQQAFVYAWIAKLQPGADEIWRHNPAQAAAYFARLWDFVNKLPAVFNSLKSQVLYHWLVLDRSQGRYDLARFMEYLKLPRFQPYMSKAMLESEQFRRYPADLNADYRAVTLLPAVGPDESLVRSYLKNFFVEANSPKEYEPFINDEYLRHLFAETKIELGLGDPEQWASQLPPEQFKQFKDRVDIDFAYTNPTHYTIDQPVKLDVSIKNIPTLLVKVYEINTLNYYRQNSTEVNTDINLDGLVPNEEQTYNFNESPLRRVTKQFEFAKLNKPGVYVIDYIGGGKSSRALIRKGKFHTLVSSGTAGQVVTVIDENYKQVKNAKLCMTGAEYTADKDGTIFVPYSTQPGRKPIVVTVGDFACLDFLNHQAEGYTLTAGIHIERESLLNQRLAKVLVRPCVYINGIPQSLQLLSHVKLRLIATDQDGIASTTEVPDFKIFEDRESTYEFRVPPRLQSLQVHLFAEVKNLSQNISVQLADGQTFALNGIDLTDKTEDLHLAKFGSDYVIEVLGKTGEPKKDRPVQLALKHREFRELVQVTLKSDNNGRVKLGQMQDIIALTATGPEGTAQSWTLPLARFTYRNVMHAKSGEAITLPYNGTVNEPSHAELALFEMRGNTYRSDRFDALRIKDGLIEIQGLEAGDYELWLKASNERIRIRIGDGTVYDGYVLGNARFMQLPALKPVSIAKIDVDGEGNLTIHLKNWSKVARLHVFGTRYLPSYSAFADLAKVHEPTLIGVVPGRNDSTHITGRDIGDEYRYVLDRKLQKKFPGNMLERPQLLLNPWAVRTTETSEQLAAEGAAFGAVNAPAPAAMMSSDAKPDASEILNGKHGAHVTSNFDFLADTASVVVNQVPNEQGIITISRKELAPHAWIHLVAVDAVHTSVKSLSVAEQQAGFLDLRLRSGLDPKGHFTQQKQVTTVLPGTPFILSDVNNSRFEMYDQLSKVYSLYRTLSNDPNLTEFAFILNWPTMKPEEKRTLYSKYACHELSFFLSKKDPEFFNTVVKPYLANKKDKTFMDHWLLGSDLALYLEPWRYGRLNTVERILLAQRLQGEAALTTRHLTDLFRMLPPDLERVLMLFDTSVKGSDLSSGAVFAEEKAKRSLKESLRDENMAFKAARAPAGMGGGGLGGGGQGGGVLEGQVNAATGRPASPVTPSKGEARASLRRGGAKDGESREEQAQDRKKAMSGEDKLAKADAFYRDDRGRAQFKQLYMRLAPTQEWAENNYYHLLIQAQLAELVTINSFWLDYIKHNGNGPFYSRDFPQASRNFTEMMFALSVLDLPYAAGKHEMKFDAGRMTLNVTSPVIAFHEEVRPAVAAKTKLPILISQNFYRASDRYREENGEKIDHFVTEEFLTHTTYGGQIVVTNPTSSRQKLTVLYQLPVGAMALGKGQQTKSILLDLEPYRTQTIDYLFYFPAAGQFAQFPVHVAKNEQYVASAEPFTFNVVEKATKIDTESWDYVSQEGTPEQVLALLNRENLYRLNLDKIAFRMKDKAFFQAVTKLLRDRHVYQNTLWSYAVELNLVPEMKEFFRHANNLINLCANGPLATTLLTIDPTARYYYQHLEYKPLVNARAHALGKVRQIVNDRFHQQYHQFMTMLSYKRTFDDADLLSITYYLLLQDRVEEALETFSRVNADKLATKMQYDYCAAYLAFFTEEPGKARAIALKYANHPVDRWKNTFATIITQLDEIEGKVVKAADADDRNQRQAELAAGESSYDFTIDAKKINLTWQNVQTVRVNYYLMDVELLFSRNPFVQQYGSQFSAIKPNQTQDVTLPLGQKKLTIDLPKDLVNRNVLVEIVAGGKTRSQPYYANALEVTLQENYGQLKVVNAATSKALPKVYVKVYVRLADGTVKFHKDGYTDLRGKFDYASVSTPEKSPINRFSILVLSDEFGALIKETNPPAQ